MALEFQTITSQEFLRLGAHGELDWARSLKTLSMLAKGFFDGTTELAMLDLRDARMELSDEQVEALAETLHRVGLRGRHRVAILLSPAVHRHSPTFVNAARMRGFDIARFFDYEHAAEWLSEPVGPDPDFDREIYRGPGDEADGDPFDDPD